MQVTSQPLVNQKIHNKPQTHTPFIRNIPKNYHIAQKLKKSTEQKKNLRLSPKPQMKELKPNVASQYAVTIVQNDQRSYSNSNSKTAENSANLKRIQKKYAQKVMKDEKQWPKRLSERRNSISSSKQSKKSFKSQTSHRKFEKKIGNISKDQSSQQKRELSQQKRIRYIRLCSEKKEQLLKEGKDSRQNKELKEELQKYKQKYQKSLEAIGKMQKYIINEKKKFDLQKHICIEQIKNLQSQIDSRRCLGHLFTFKQFDPSKLLPDSLIIQKEENISDISQHQKLDTQKCEQLLEEYLQLQLPPAGSETHSNLSLDSK